MFAYGFPNEMIMAQEVIKKGDKVLFYNYDEFYLVDLAKTLYFMADDHYSYVYFSQQTYFMIPFGLTSVIDAISDGNATFARVGRKLVINMDTLVHVNISRQTLTLRDTDGGKIELHASRQSLKELAQSIRSSFAD